MIADQQQTGNPVADELIGLSPAAKQALHSGIENHLSTTGPAPAQPDMPGMIGVPQGTSAPPSSGPVPGAIPLPNHPAAPTSAAPGMIPLPQSALPAPKSTVIPGGIPIPRATPAADDAERIRKSGSGTSQIHNPWLRIPVQVADAVGSTFLPGLMAGIPGSQLHHEVLQNQAEGAAKTEQSANESEARQGQQDAQARREETLTASQPTEDALRGAQTEEAKARAQSLAHPVEKESDPEKDAYKFYLSQGTSPEEAYAKILALKAGAGTKDQKEKSPEVQAYESLLKQGKSPEEAYAQTKKLGQAEKTDTAAQDDQKYEALLSKQLQGKAITPEEKADMAAYKSRKTLGQQVTNVYANERESKKEAAAGDKQADTAKGKLKDTFRKEFSGVQSQLDAIEDARNELASNPVGQSLGTIKTIVAVAGGKGSGVRITQAELNSVVKDLGIKESFENWVSNISGQGKMSPATLAKVNQVLSAVEKRAIEKEQHLNGTLDQIDSAKSKEDLTKIEQDYRHGSLHGTPGGEHKVGDTKTFPNGKTGEWDGKGWVAK